MSRGRGVFLQRYKDGGLADVKTFTLKDGLSWAHRRPQSHRNQPPGMARQTRPSRKLPPKGFAKANRFREAGRVGVELPGLRSASQWRGAQHAVRVL